MDGFGRGRRFSSELLLVCALMLTTLQFQHHAQALTLSSRVVRNSVDANAGNDQTYYASIGDNIIIYCYCRNVQSSNISSVELVHNSIYISNRTGCNTLIERMPNVSFHNAGRYTCLVRLTNGTLRRSQVGNLQVINPSSVILAPPVQFGLLNNLTKLNCSSTFNNSAVRWLNNSIRGNGMIDSVELSHQGQYLCEVSLISMSLTRRKSIQFIVIVPPRVINPPEHMNFIRNSDVTLEVKYQSKNDNDTRISWYNNNTPVEDHRLTKVNVSLTESIYKTVLSFSPIRRSDGGQYRVVIENTHSIIPHQLRTTVAHFRVVVSILPAIPTLTVARTNSTSALLTWYFNNTTTDDLPDSQSVFVYYVNDSVAMQISLSGGVREIQPSLIPGVQYRAEVLAQNQDGNVTSERQTFMTQPGDPLLSEVRVTRSIDRNNSLHLEATLLYTGGGGIQCFVLSFRYFGSTEWEQLENVQAESSDDPLVWSTEVVRDGFKDGRVELQVQAVNAHGFHSNMIEQVENIVLPGVPRIRSISSDTNSLLISVELSRVGSVPLTKLEVKFSSPQNSICNITGLRLIPGRSVEVLLSDLQDGTLYRFSVSAYNYGGKGNSSTTFQLATVMKPPLSVLGIAMVVVSAGILLVIVLILIVVVWKKYSNLKRRKREYNFTDSESKETRCSSSDQEHAIVKRHSNSSPISPLSPTPPTPSTATSVLSPHTSPPGFYPTPPYKSPSSAFTNSVPGRTPLSGPLSSSFKFDTGSSGSNSVNQDSDISESNFPRYTYTLPQSMEGTPQGTPQVARAYDQVDLPYEHQVSFNEVRLHEPVLKSAISHDAVRFPGYQRRFGSDASHIQKSYKDIDSPQLRTQSTHSMATTCTRLTSSDSMGTRDSLLYPHIETNTTNV